VAAAAVAAAEVAARAAIMVEVEAAIRAVDVAAAAARASETAAAAPSTVAHPREAKRVAAVVAATVAADVVAQTRLTDDAASRVAEAVALAADDAASAAATAASLIEAAAGAAETSAHDVVGSSAATEIASGITVDSTERTAELALSRVARLQRSPMVAELLRAVEDEELRLHFQPMYSMGNGAIVGVEALIRWQHPTRGLLHPADFLDVAEGPHLVTPIGDWVLHAAAAQATAWQREVGDQAPVMWVNISCDQLGRHHLTGVVERLLSESGLEPGLLGIEVTERQLARRVDDVAEDLLELRELGVALAVDDFGTGYASLDYLQRFAFDEIKIDRSFVSGLEDRTSAVVTSSIIALARSLDLTVVGEGVETQAQFDRLRMLGCDVAQGYLLHRPAVAETITAALHGRAQQPA
jgi:EAL domain-containing protein (putative c-di-GMP-specific phosphodiesterase class I)